MAATFVGTSLNAKVLRSTSQSIETNGLVTLEETYTVKTSLAQSIVPRTDTTHSAFSSATTKYATMYVESTSLKEELGGISTLTVQYAGLLSSVLPRPVVRAIPIVPLRQGAATYSSSQMYNGEFRFVGPDGDYAIKNESGPELQIEFVILSSGTYLPRGKMTTVDVSVDPIALSTTRVFMGSPLPFNINGFPIGLAGKTTIDAVSGIANLGYILMNEENFKRGNAIILTQIYRKVSLASKILRPGQFPRRDYYLYESDWWARYFESHRTGA